MLQWHHTGVYVCHQHVKQPDHEWVSPRKGQPSQTNRWKCDWQMQYSSCIYLVEWCQWTSAVWIHLFWGLKNIWRNLFRSLLRHKSVIPNKTQTQNNKQVFLPTVVVYRASKTSAVFVSMYFIKKPLFFGVGDSWHCKCFIIHSLPPLSINKK